MSTVENGNESKHEREQFGSRAAFYFAAVGSAVGFGNVWRFPSLAYKYGGGAFFVPYLLALVFIGLPVLFLEIGLGQFFQRGDVTVFAVCHKRMRGVGICSIACGYITLTYYSMLLTWTTRALFESGSSAAPWSNSTATSDDGVSYFFNEIIGGGEMSDMPTKLVGANVGYSLLMQAIIFLCIGFGLKITGIITYVTMGLPTVFLFIFLFLGISLEGSELGIKQYIGQWDMSTLKGEAWSTAVTQIFFSLSLTFGVMTSYGSHMPRNEPAFINSCVVAVANSLFSFIAGFAVFSVVGHQAYRSNMDVEAVADGANSFGLVFGMWPIVLSAQPGGIHWVRLLFIFLMLLGLDSAFSFQEAVLTCLRDTELLRDSPKWLVALSITVLCWLLGLIYTTDAGLSFLDVIDFYVNFVMLFIGFIESFAVGWIFGIEEQIEKFGAAAVFTYMFANFGSVLIACGFWFGVNIWSGFVALAVSYGIFLGLTVYFLNMSDGTISDPLLKKLLDLAFGNILDFKEKAEPIIKIVPTIWCFLIKQFIPHVLLFLFVNLAQSKTDKGDSLFGNYGSYATAPYQVLGILSFVFAAVLFLAGIFAPIIYAPLDTREEFGSDGAVKPAFPVKNEEDEA